MAVELFIPPSHTFWAGAVADVADAADVEVRNVAAIVIFVIFVDWAMSLGADSD